MWRFSFSEFLSSVFILKLYSIPRGLSLSHLPLVSGCALSYESRVVTRWLGLGGSWVSLGRELDSEQTSLDIVCRELVPVHPLLWISLVANLVLRAQLHKASQMDKSKNGGAESNPTDYETSFVEETQNMDNGKEAGSLHHGGEKKGQ